MCLPRLGFVLQSEGAIFKSIMLHASCRIPAQHIGNGHLIINPKILVMVSALKNQDVRSVEALWIQLSGKIGAVF